MARIEAGTSGKLSGMLATDPLRCSSVVKGVPGSFQAKMKKCYNSGMRSKHYSSRRDICHVVV